MKFFHVYSGDTIFGERSGIFIEMGRGKVEGISIILKVAGKKKRKLKIDHGDRQVYAPPVWWVRFYYRSVWRKHWLLGKVGARYGLGARGEGPFVGV